MFEFVSVIINLAIIYYLSKHQRNINSFINQLEVRIKNLEDKN